MYTLRIKDLLILPLYVLNIRKPCDIFFKDHEVYKSNVQIIGRLCIDFLDAKEFLKEVLFLKCHI